MKLSLLSTLLLSSSLVSAAAVPAARPEIDNVDAVPATYNPEKDPASLEFKITLPDDLDPEETPEDTIPATLEKRETTNQLTDRLMFSTGINIFLWHKERQTSKDVLIWTDNGCNNSPDTPFGFNFKDACKRHDFGYRNYKKQKRFTEANRLRIDNKFKEDMYYFCTHEGILESPCRGLANTYYAFVREFGDN